MRSIGLDVHRQFAEVAVAQGGQAVPSGHRFEASPAGLLAFARSLGKEDQVVLEATVNTWAIVDVLAAHAGRVVVSNLLRTRAIASAKVKTDKIDAATLAQLLAADFLPEVWIPDPETRSRRAQVAHRAGLVQQRSRLRNRVEAVLHRNLLECPWTDTFGKRGCQWLAHLNLPPADREQLDSTLRQLDCIEAEVARADQLIAETTLGDPRIQRLMTIPGVGVTTAAALVAVVGDVVRFPRPNQLVGYLGLDPRVRQSGNKPAYTGHISRQGQAHARGLGALGTGTLAGGRLHRGPPRAHRLRDPVGIGLAEADAQPALDDHGPDVQQVEHRGGAQGSGAIEKTTDVAVGRRLEAKGTSWFRPGAHRLLSLRILKQDRTWDRYGQARRSRTSLLAPLAACRNRACIPSKPGTLTPDQGPYKLIRTSNRSA